MIHSCHPIKNQDYQNFNEFQFCLFAQEGHKKEMNFGKTNGKTQNVCNFTNYRLSYKFSKNTYKQDISTAMVLSNLLTSFASGEQSQKSNGLLNKDGIKDGMEPLKEDKSL